MCKVRDVGVSGSAEAAQQLVGFVLQVVSLELRI